MNSNNLLWKVLKCAIMTVNWPEVLQISLVQGINTADLQTDFEALDVQFVPFSSLHSELAAQLWPNTKSFVISLGDRACIALAFDLQVIAQPCSILKSHSHRKAHAPRCL
jgi:ribonuclease VapC